MPSIDREKANSPEWRKEYELNRFVRIGRIFFYSENYRTLHSKIATDNGAQLNTEAPHRPLVDDGGEMRIIDGKLAFTGTTSSCDIKGDENEARTESYRLATEQFGADIVNPFAT